MLPPQISRYPSFKPSTLIHPSHPLTITLSAAKISTRARGEGKAPRINPTAGIHDSPTLQHLHPTLHSAPQLIMAEAAAAGIHRGGLRRQAFSTGDLQALQPAPEDAPVRVGPPPAGLSRGPLVVVGSSRALPRLESVPEGATAAPSDPNRCMCARVLQIPVDISNELGFL